MTHDSNLPIVVGVCGASGQTYGRAVLKRLLASGRAVDVIVSNSAKSICAEELDSDDIADGLTGGLLKRYEPDAMHSPPASGSYPTAGMIVCPCTLNTLAAIACGISDNLIKRAAQIHVKERRRLVIAVREMPVSLIDLENMARLARAGADVWPLSPGFYHRPKTIDGLVQFAAERLVERVADIPASFRYG